MKIVVCIKQIDFLYHPVGVETQTDAIDPEKTVPMLNPYDEIAVEAAVDVKERRDDCEVMLVTVGPAAVESTLRYAFSLGADRMIRINSEGCDAGSIAAGLAAFLKNIAYDVILCGKMALDGNNGQVGSFLAEQLNLPQVSGIVAWALSADKGSATVQRYLGRGNRQEVACPLPALFTVENGMNDPRYPTLPNRLRSQDAAVEVIDIAADPRTEPALLPPADKACYLSPPNPKPKNIFTPDSKLPAGERVRLILAGGDAKEKSGRMLEGNPAHAADVLWEILMRQKIIGLNANTD